MLDMPRLLLLRAAPPLVREEAPPKALLLLELGVLGTLRLPTRSPPALDLLEPRLLAPVVPRFAPRLPVLARFPVPRSIVPACGRLAWRETFWRAFAWRLATESPRVVPPNLFAVARSP